MNKATSLIKDHLLGFLITVIFAGGLLYSATTSWQNSRELAAQTVQLGQIHGDMTEIKKSLISVLLDKDPNKSDIIKGLISDRQTLQGIDSFKAGNFEGAYTVWTSSAQQGSTESAFAISAANAALKAQVTDKSLPAEKRAKAQAALSHAPRVENRDGETHIRK